MAGHSQFKNIMFRKGKQDKLRSKIFSKLAREITVAAKTGVTFGDQFDPNTGEVRNPTTETVGSGQSIFFPDIGAGGLFYTKSAWLGFAATHLTKPNQSLIGENSRLPMKLSGHAGYKFFFKPGVMGNGVYARRDAVLIDMHNEI